MICYDRLWKTLIDKHMNKSDLMAQTGLSFGTIAKMGKNEPVTLSVIDRICDTLGCNIEDVVEHKS